MPTRQLKMAADLSFFSFDWFVGLIHLPALQPGLAERKVVDQGMRLDAEVLNNNIDSDYE